MKVDNPRLSGSSRAWSGWNRARLAAAVAAIATTLLTAPGAMAQSEFGADAEVTRSEDTGKVVFVGTDPGQPLEPPRGIDDDAPAAEASIAYLREHDDAFGLTGDSLAVDDVKRAPDGGSAVHLQQTVEGLPVIGGELIVNLTDENEIRSVSGEALPVSRLDTDPAVGRDRAKEAAISAVAEQAEVSERDLDAAAPRLRVYDSSLFGQRGRTIVAWSMQVYSPENPLVVKQVLVDAETGDVAEVFELVHNALNRRICDGQNNRSAFNNCTAAVLNEGGNYTGGVADVQPVYDFSGQTYNFYDTRWTRDSIDGAGMDMRSTVRFCTNTTQPSPPNPPPFVDACPYQNATFVPFTPETSSQAFYGQGTGSDDIVGHELTHGVTNFESELVYQNESGAINESLSDVFGEALDLVNGQGTDTAATRWQVGEDSSLGVLRDMEDPPNNGDPDKMTASQWTFGSGDNGGVHTNSGVSNKAAFLLADGQTFNGFTVSSIGLEKTVRVYYEAQVNLLTSGSDYGALGNALRQACNNLVGGNGLVAADCTEVNDAVLATEMDTEAAAPDTTIDSGPGQTDDPTPTWTFSASTGRSGMTYECSIDQGTPSWSPCSGPGGSHTPSSDLADGTYTFRVRGSVGSATDPTPATRSVTVSTADMELVSKTDSQDPAFAGETLTYSIKARNNGPGKAENARVVDKLPEGTSYQSSSIPCTVASGEVTCGLGDLNDDEERTFTIIVAIARDLVHDNDGPITIDNKATADADRHDRQPDNDEGEESTLVKAKADLEILSSTPISAPPEMVVGEPTTVTVRKSITNNGPSAPMDVRMARGASATPNATVSPTSASRVEDALAYQEERTVDEEFEIECTGGGVATFEVTNAISPSRPDDADPDPSNNQATTSFAVQCIVPVAINIHPGSSVNPVNLKSNGNIPVAVLSTRPGEYGLPLAFDASLIHPPTARFGPKAVVTSGSGAPESHGRGHVEDAIERSDERTLDGDRDMVLHFATQRSQLTGTDTQACVRGRFGLGNFVYQGCDSVRNVP